MSELEERIAKWRQRMVTELGRRDATLDELESHLRETIDSLVRSGAPEEEAFQIAVKQLGAPSAISAELTKGDPPLWFPIKLAVGFGILAPLGVALLVATRGRISNDLLLAIHVYTVVLGYLGVFLIGGLGICYVCRRCFGEMNARGLESLARYSFALGSVAAGLIAIGIVLGMVWAGKTWGRYWSWDPKEIGALCILTWLAVWLSLQRCSSISTRVVLVMSILGNVIVTLGWFGAYRLASLHSYGMPGNGWLIFAITVNLLFILGGLAPAGFLQRKKA